MQNSWRGLSQERTSAIIDDGPPEHGGRHPSRYSCVLARVVGAAATDGPVGGVFGVAVTPERVVTARLSPPLDEQEVGIDLARAVGVVVGRGGDRSELRNPSGPRTACGFGASHERAAGGRKVGEIGESLLKFDGLGAGQKSGEKVLHVGSR
jgi:hypothetical protein